MKTYRYSTDIGCLEIQIDDNKFYVPNGYGDGDFFIYIDDDGKIDTSDLRYVMNISSKNIELCVYDCYNYCDNVKLDGDYSVYKSKYFGNFIFVKLAN